MLNNNIFFFEESEKIYKPRNLMWEDKIDSLIKYNHSYSSKAPPSVIFNYKGLSIRGPGIVFDKDNNIEIDKSIYPSYVFREQYKWCKTSEKARNLTIDKAFSIWHYNCNTYGHWLLEAVPKILLIKKLSQYNASLKKIPIVIPNNIKNFVLKQIEFYLPDFNIIKFDPINEIVNVNDLFLPAWGEKYYYSDLVVDQFLKIRNSFFCDFSFEKIYISRRLNPRRRLPDFNSMESIAIKNGFQIIYPENLTLQQQIRVFVNAKYIVGEFGSGLHNSIFSPEESKVISINYINECQSRIGNLFNQSVGYILSADGRRLGHVPTENDLQNFKIDLNEFEDKLRQFL